MARQEGTYKFSGNFEPRFSAPTDARLSANTKAELYTIQYAYRGMIVYIKDEDAYYKLVNDLPAYPASWVMYGGDGDFDEITEAEIDEMFN